MCDSRAFVALSSSPRSVCARLIATELWWIIRRKPARSSGHAHKKHAFLVCNRMSHHSDHHSGAGTEQLYRLLVNQCIDIYNKNLCFEIMHNCSILGLSHRRLKTRPSVAQIYNQLACLFECGAWRLNSNSDDFRRNISNQSNDFSVGDSDLVNN